MREELERLLRHQSGVRRFPPILIQGESGTGKGLFAHLIHRAARGAGPFVDVNCAAIPETLLEAEMFGFERGAFTDARQAKPGLFQAANAGTIFLDEVGLLPGALQTKLLKVIEDREVRRLGSTRTEAVDVWIIAATAEDLEAVVKARRFREDLYHRLAVVTVRLPPLRQRGEDILALAQHFLARVCSDYGLPPKTLTPDARQALLAYRWPGNVRELANLVERVALLSETSEVTAEALRLQRPLADREAVKENASASGGSQRRERLVAALEETDWNVSRAAGSLGISRNALRYWIAKYRLSRGTRSIALPAMGGKPAAATGPAHTEPDARWVEGVQWERRHLALLHVALSDSGAAASEISRTFELVAQKIETFGGRIEEIGLTSLLAAFGIEAAEDAARRAAHAAIAIRGAAERSDRGNRGPAVVRLAIHAGHFTLGRRNGEIQIAVDDKRDAAVLLDQIIAAAAPQSILVTESAAPFLDRRFELVPVPDPTPGVWRSLFRLVGRERPGFELRGQITRFVGRSSELEQLERALARAGRGQGQIVALVGEPGVGKSRLVHQFLQGLPGLAAWSVLEARAASYGKGTPYLPVTNLLRRYFDIQDREDPQDIRKKIITKVLSLDDALAPQLPALLALLDVPADDAGWKDLEPPQRRQRTLDALKRLVVRHSLTRPLVLIFEDLHWIDSETQAILETLVDGIPAVPIMLLLTYRPEYQHGWGNKTFYTQLRIDPLPPENADELLAGLLGADLSLEPLKRLLVDRTEGNPFFLEESVRTLLETDVLSGEPGCYSLVRPIGAIEVPATAQAVLAARIARLPERERGLLQTAAVVGRDVPLTLLAAVVDLPGDALSQHIAHLQAAEFLYETRLFPEVEYIFKHALTHEVAYASVLDEQRRDLHARIVAVIEQLYTGRLIEQVERLAHHALRAEMWSTAVTHLREAGVKAVARSANQEAVAWLDQALLALKHLPECRDTIERGLDLRFDLRNSLWPLGELGRLLDVLREAEAAAEQLGDQGRLGRASIYLTHCLWGVGDNEAAVAAGERAATIGTELGNLGLQVLANNYLSYAYHALGQYGRTIDLLERNLALLEGDLLLERFGMYAPPSAFSRIWLALCFSELGQFGRGIARGDEAVRVIEKVESPYALAVACWGLGHLYLRKGEFDQAGVQLERALALSRECDLVGIYPLCRSFLGSAYALSGRLTEAIPLLEDGVDLLVPMRQRLYFSLVLTRLGEGYLLAGRKDDAFQVAGRALDVARQQKERGHQAWALRLLGEIAAQRDPLDAQEAEVYYRQATALAQELGMRPLVAHCHLGLGKLYRRTGKRQEAQEHLTTATTMCREMDMGLWLEQAEAETKELS